MAIEDLIKNASISTAQVKQSSAMNPLLWIVGITSSLLVFAILIINIIWLQILFIILLFVIILSTIGCFIYFAWKKPELLRSEKFELLKKQMEMMGDQNYIVSEAELKERETLDLPTKIDDFIELEDTSNNNKTF